MRWLDLLAWWSSQEVVVRGLGVMLLMLYAFTRVAIDLATLPRRIRQWRELR